LFVKSNMFTFSQYWYRFRIWNRCGLSWPAGWPRWISWCLNRYYLGWLNILWYDELNRVVSLLLCRWVPIARSIFASKIERYFRESFFRESKTRSSPDFDKTGWLEGWGFQPADLQIFLETFNSVTIFRIYWSFPSWGIEPTTTFFFNLVLKMSFLRPILATLWVRDQNNPTNSGKMLNCIFPHFNN